MPTAAGAVERLTTYHQAAKSLGVSAHTFLRLVAEHGLKVERAGRLTLVRLKDVEQLRNALGNEPRDAA
jgi:excisionase family DNA binding protein